MLFVLGDQLSHVFALRREQNSLSQQPSAKASEKVGGYSLLTLIVPREQCEQERSNCPFRVQRSKTYQLTRLFSSSTRCSGTLLAVQTSKVSRPTGLRKLLFDQESPTDDFAQSIACPRLWNCRLPVYPIRLSKVTPWKSLQYIGGMRLARSMKGVSGTMALLPLFR